MKIIKQRNGDVSFKFDTQEQEVEFLNSFIEYHIMMRNPIDVDKLIMDGHDYDLIFEIDTENGIQPWEVPNEGD